MGLIPALQLIVLLLIIKFPLDLYVTERCMINSQGTINGCPHLKPDIFFTAILSGESKHYAP
jgi:hypothetical protein